MLPQPVKRGSQSLSVSLTNKLPKLLKDNYNENDPISGYKLLLVNDEPSILLVLETLFTMKIGIKRENIQKATDGNQALQKATITNFDLIIMDLNMPVMDGFEACKKIKALFSKKPEIRNTSSDSSDTPA